MRYSIRNIPTLTFDNTMHYNRRHGGLNFMTLKTNGRITMYTLKEAAALKGCTKQAVHALARRRRVTGQRWGNMMCFTIADLARLGITVVASASAGKGI